MRLDSGKIKLNIEPVDLGKLLHDLELQYRPLAQAKGLQFRVHVTPGTRDVRSHPAAADRRQPDLQRGEVHAARRRAGGVARHARAAAASRCGTPGVGIAPVHQREIFREFYKVPSHAGTEDGFGLGLYIVARLSRDPGSPA